MDAATEGSNDDGDPDGNQEGGSTRPLNVGMVATRLAGTDGVTLESRKMAAVLEQAGHRVTSFAGLLDERFSSGRLVPDAHFETELNRALERHCFGTTDPLPPTIRRELEEQAVLLEHALRGFVEQEHVDVLIAQNCLSIPMQIPLGLALASVIQGSRIPAIGHHHDFSWERERFRVRPREVERFLSYAFPPTHIPSLRHLVIHSGAAAELKRRRGATSTLLPNVMDFEHPPEPGDPARFRRWFHIDEGKKILLQPTRVVPRKRIEATIDLADTLARTGGPQVVVVVTHEEGDEGTAYGDRIRALARAKGVDLRACPVPLRPCTRDGFPTLADAYAAADLVCYPSMVEGFGNALVEAVYFRRPVLTNRYSVYVSDIAPLGLQCIEISGGEITPAAVEEARACLERPELWDEICRRNYAIGREHLSYKVLRDRVLPLLRSVPEVPAPPQAAVRGVGAPAVREVIRRELALVGARPGGGDQSIAAGD